jgi:hypothetical protein
MSDTAGWESARDLRWWRRDLASVDRYKHLLETASKIRKASDWRKATDVARIRLYGSTSMISSGIAQTSSPSANARRKVGYNVIACVGNARVAKITKQNPKVSFVTERGDWELQQRARALEKFIEGQFYEMELYELGPLIVLDGDVIFGKGFVKLFIEGQGEDCRIQCERVLPLELLVDEQEALKGKPRNLIQQSWVDRVILEELYADEKEKLDAIRKARAGYDPHSGTHMTVGYDSTADQILVVEGWHLRSARKSTDGRHVMAIDGATLEDDEWVHDWFPFICYESTPSPLGWWGIPVTDTLDGIQESMNRKLMRVDESLNLLGSGHILVHAGSKVNFGKWDNQVGSKIEYQGIKPELFVADRVVPDAIFAQIDRDYSKAFGLTGTPEAEAQGMVPANLESGKAQEVHLDVTDQRIQVAINRYHHMFLKAAEIILEFGREIVEAPWGNTKFGAKASDRGNMRRVFLKENDLQADEYVLKLWPTNGLSDEPGARMGQVEKMAGAGWIAPDQAKRLLNMPDLEEANDLENASYNAVEQCISDMLDDGRYRPPQPFLNLTQAVQQVQLALIKGWSDGRPEARLQLLRDWLNDATALPEGPGGPLPVQTQASAGGTPVAAAPVWGVTPATGAPAGPAPPVAA